jgi:tRNA pseudouridine32 synthase/23S rRNA pseudouridine746 synthase
MAYYPESGRTHQLGIHSAHPDGMDCPVLGDPLYGQAADRIYLHAESLEFRHPHTGESISIEKKAPF